MTDAGPTIRFSDRVSRRRDPLVRDADPSLLDLAGPLARPGSAAYLPGSGTPGHAALVVAMRQLFHHVARDGRVVRRWELEPAA